MRVASLRLVRGSEELGVTDTRSAEDLVESDTDEDTEIPGVGELGPKEKDPVE